jgi:hypothetical protein
MYIRGKTGLGGCLTGVGGGGGRGGGGHSGQKMNKLPTFATTAQNVGATYLGRAKEHRAKQGR